MNDEELRDLLARSHQLAVSKLSKRRQIGLLLDEQTTSTCRSALARDRVRSARKISETLKFYDC